MSQPLSHRLQLLDSILAGSTGLAGVRREEIESVALCLRSVPFDRMKQLTVMLTDQDGRGTDDIDRVAAQLLLTDYRTAVANLRTATQVVASRLTAAAVTLKPVRGFVRRSEKIAARQLKRRG